MRRSVQKSPCAPCSSRDSGAKHPKHDPAVSAVAKARGASTLKFCASSAKTDETDASGAGCDPAKSHGVVLSDAMELHAAKPSPANAEYDLLDSPGADDEIKLSISKESKVVRRKRQVLPDVDTADSVSNSLTKSVAKKRQLEEELPEVDDDNDVNPDVSHDMQKMLETFGVDINKNLSVRRKKLEQYTTGCLKSGTRKMEETLQLQQEQRQKLRSEFETRSLAIFNQWDADMEKIKENEEKLQNQLRQQQKMFQQFRMVQAQRMTAMKDLYESHCKNSDELERSHQAQQMTSQAEMKRELMLLQKKILMDAQKTEMENVRKSLNTLFY